MSLTTKTKRSSLKPPKYAFMKRAALALPGAVEVLDRYGWWFNVGKKTFAMCSNKQRWILRLPKEQVRMLVEADPGVFAPMIAGALYWLYMDVEKLDAATLKGYLEAAWRYTAPKTLQKDMP
ncbi:MAG TPA: MmcQ/YjbR family DNA-binding protein [Rhizomicrobium sp.]|jgi:hypothetical protein|nr:MmcQ/YjbR family DNA-binding protein [Rhizomicrobium sp.]